MKHDSRGVLACCLQVRLMDFNPVGGTTSPLLFNWDELPFELPAGTAAAEPTLAAHEQPAVETSCSGVELTAAATDSSVPQERSCPCGSPTATASSSTSRGEAEENQGNDWNGLGGNEHEVGQGGSNEILFRLATADSRLRPSAAVYGAPFEMADLSKGGAIDALISKLQVEHQAT